MCIFHTTSCEPFFPATYSVFQALNLPCIVHTLTSAVDTHLGRIGFDWRFERRHNWGYTFMILKVTLSDFRPSSPNPVNAIYERCYTVKLMCTKFCHLAKSRTGSILPTNPIFNRLYALTSNCFITVLWEFCDFCHYHHIVMIDS